MSTVEVEQRTYRERERRGERIRITDEIVDGDIRVSGSTINQCWSLVMTAMHPGGALAALDKGVVCGDQMM